MNFLEKITATKCRDTTKDRQYKSLVELKIERIGHSMASNLQLYRTSSATQCKRNLLSKIIISSRTDMEKLTCDYKATIGSDMSVFSDIKHFAARCENPPIARRKISIPTLRKDFIQVIATKFMRIDFIALIVIFLLKERRKRLAVQAKMAGLKGLIEVHSENGRDKITDDFDLVEIINRDLKAFSIDIKCLKQLFPNISDRLVKISWNFLSKPEPIIYLQKISFQGFLIKENFQYINISV